MNLFMGSPMRQNLDILFVLLSRVGQDSRERMVYILDSAHFTKLTKWIGWCFKNAPFSLAIHNFLWLNLTTNNKDDAVLNEGIFAIVVA